MYFSYYSIFLYFYIKNKIDKKLKKNKKKHVKQNKGKLKNNQTKTDNHLKAERKMDMHEGMIEKVDKKPSKESPTLDRKN